MTKSVVVVEDDRGLRNQIVAIFRTAPDIKCVGAFATGEEALAKIPSQKPDVVLMDIGLPVMSGIHCVGHLKILIPTTLVIMSSVFDDTVSILKVFSSRCNGYLI